MHVFVAVGGLGEGGAGDKKTEREYGGKGNLHRGPFYRWGPAGRAGGGGWGCRPCACPETSRAGGGISVWVCNGPWTG
ncbi:hypothetical protein BN1263170024 [Stenotrophomonas maltophilia]|nr:hypothetical protein BN1263170024 [Stenotrophomonas maltophilia]